MISHEKSFTTSKGEFKIKIKKTKQEKIVLSIHNKKYGYPLLKDEFDDEVKAIKEFNYHCKKIQKEEFKLIRNFESLDSHYQRVFTRDKYGILIL